MIVLNLNARFQPVHRFELEDALDEIMGKMGLGEVCGGGTLLSPTKEVKSCDIELDVNDDDKTVETLLDIIDKLGVPKGSKFILSDSSEKKEIPVGRLEGLAVYLNGTELPAEVYQSCDINYAIEQMDERLSGIGRLYSWWEGSQDTALYFYGESYNKMLDAIKDFIEEYPLCDKCRIEQIA